MSRLWRTRTVALAMAVPLIIGGSAMAADGSPSPEPSPMQRELFRATDMGYSEASRYGDLIWTAGHLPFQADSSDPFATQVEAVLDNLEATLEEVGGGFDTVLKTNVYLLSFDDWPVFNEIYMRRVGMFGMPPRTTVQVAGLGFGRIEIEMVAHVRAP